MPLPAHLLAPNEAQRLEALAHLDVAAALAEPIFEELITALAHFYRLPIAFLSVVGAEQTVFVATHGVPGLRALPREASLCALPVRQGSVLALNHLLTADENAHQQTARALGLAAYLGAPLLVPDELAVGALCLSSPVPREFSAAETQTLEAVADMVSWAVAERLASLRQDGGQRWRRLQQLLREALAALQGLAAYLTRNQPPLPTAEVLLASVRLRLASLPVQLDGRVG